MPWLNLFRRQTSAESTNVEDRERASSSVKNSDTASRDRNNQCGESSEKSSCGALAPGDDESPAANLTDGPHVVDKDVVAPINNNAGGVRGVLFARRRARNISSNARTQKQEMTNRQHHRRPNSSPPLTALASSNATEVMNIHKKDDVEEGFVGENKLQEQDSDELPQRPRQSQQQKLPSPPGIGAKQPRARHLRRSQSPPQNHHHQGLSLPRSPSSSSTVSTAPSSSRTIHSTRTVASALSTRAFPVKEKGEELQLEVNVCMPPSAPRTVTVAVAVVAEEENEDVKKCGSDNQSNKGSTDRNNNTPTLEEESVTASDLENEVIRVEDLVESGGDDQEQYNQEQHNEAMTAEAGTTGPIPEVKRSSLLDQLQKMDMRRDAMSANTTLHKPSLSLPNESIMESEATSRGESNRSVARKTGRNHNERSAGPEPLVPAQVVCVHSSDAVRQVRNAAMSGSAVKEETTDANPDSIPLHSQTATIDSRSASSEAAASTRRASPSSSLSPCADSLRASPSFSRTNGSPNGRVVVGGSTSSGSGLFSSTSCSSKSDSMTRGVRTYSLRGHSRVRSAPSSATLLLGGPTPLYYAVSSRAPPYVIRSLIEADPSSTGVQNGGGLTPLHCAIERYDTPLEVIRLLVEANPSTARVKSRKGTTPVGLLWKRFVDPDLYRSIEVRRAAARLRKLMEDATADDSDGDLGTNVEATSAFSRVDIKRHDEDDVKPTQLLKHHDVNYEKERERKERALAALNGSLELRQFWDVMTLFVKAAHHGTTVDVVLPERGRDPWSVVHSAVAIGCPPLFVRFASALHPEQLRERDKANHDRLPLHVAAYAPVVSSTPTLAGGLGRASEKTTIHTLVRLYPNAASCIDADGRLPIHLAVESNKSWEGGVREIFKAYPHGLLVKDKKSNLFPCMLAAVGYDANLDSVYCLIKESPLEVARAALNGW